MLSQPQILTEQLLNYLRIYCSLNGKRSLTINKQSKNKGSPKKREDR